MRHQDNGNVQLAPILSSNILDAKFKFDIPIHGVVNDIRLELLSKSTLYLALKNIDFRNVLICSNENLVGYYYNVKLIPTSPINSYYLQLYYGDETRNIISDGYSGNFGTFGGTTDKSNTKFRFVPT